MRREGRWGEGAKIYRSAGRMSKGVRVSLPFEKLVRRHHSTCRFEEVTLT